MLKLIQNLMLVNYEKRKNWIPRIKNSKTAIRELSKKLKKSTITDMI